jgi:hypothetical protein
MKKYSISILSILAVIIITVGSSSCSRKIGCYWSVTPEIKSWRTNVLTELPDMFPSENIATSNSEMPVAMTTNCE